MSAQVKGISLSLVIHAVTLSLLFSLATNKPVQKKSLALDFSLIRENRPVAAAAEEEAIQPAPVRAVKTVEAPPLIKPMAGQAKLPALKKSVEKKRVMNAEKAAPRPIPVAAALPVEAPAIAPEAATATVDAAPLMDTVIAEVKETGVPEGAVGQRTDSVEESYRKANFITIRDQIVENRVYPGIARRRGWEGRVLLSFLICEDGRVEAIRIIESSGHKILDNNAMATIRKAAPFPRPPAGVRIVIPLTYRLA